MLIWANFEFFQKSQNSLYNLCNPFKHDLRYASLSVMLSLFSRKERREKEDAAEVVFERVTEIMSGLNSLGQLILEIFPGTIYFKSLRKVALMTLILISRDSIT